MAQPISSYIPVYGGNIVSIGTDIYIVNSMSSSGIPAYDQYLDTETNQWYKMTTRTDATNLYGAYVIAIDSTIFLLSNYDGQVWSLDTSFKSLTGPGEMHTTQGPVSPADNKWKLRSDYYQPIWTRKNVVLPEIYVQRTSFLMTPVIVVNKFIYKFGYGIVSIFNTNIPSNGWYVFNLSWNLPSITRKPGPECKYNSLNNSTLFTGTQFKLISIKNKIYIMGGYYLNSSKTWVPSQHVYSFDTSMFQSCITSVTSRRNCKGSDPSLNANWNLCKEPNMKLKDFRINYGVLINNNIIYIFGGVDPMKNNKPISTIVYRDMSIASSGWIFSNISLTVSENSPSGNEHDTAHIITTAIQIKPKVQVYINTSSPSTSPPSTSSPSTSSPSTAPPSTSSPSYNPTHFLLGINIYLFNNYQSWGSPIQQMPPTVAHKTAIPGDGGRGNAVQLTSPGEPSTYSNINLENIFSVNVSTNYQLQRYCDTQLGITCRQGNCCNNKCCLGECRSGECCIPRFQSSIPNVSCCSGLKIDDTGQGSDKPTYECLSPPHCVGGENNGETCNPQISPDPCKPGFCKKDLKHPVTFIPVTKAPVKPKPNIGIIVGIIVGSLFTIILIIIGIRTTPALKKSK